MIAVRYNGDYKENWNSYLLDNPKSSFFHTLDWKDIIERVYGFEPCYFLAMEGDDVKGIVCSFFTKSVIFGKKIISTPFNFYNEPLFDDADAASVLIKAVIDIAKHKDVKYVEFKSLSEFDNSIASNFSLVKNDHYFISGLQLKGTPDESVKSYTSRLTKNLRTLKSNALKNNIKVRELSSVSDLEAFYDVLVRLYRDKHNMIPQPYSLFRSLYDLGEKKFRLLVCTKDDKVVGGMVLLFFKDQVVYAYGASNPDYANFSPSTLLVDHAINLVSGLGCSHMDFGVTSPYQEGLLNFKSSFGATPKKLPFYYHLLKVDKVPELDYHTSFKSLRKPFRFVPVPIIKKLSPIVTRQLG
jgi:CelD/BcsL family acetyltransferase involved in cellulose biosynthesis